jgi:hypothetical protein
MMPWSLPQAISEPVVVSAPSMTSKPSALRVTADISLAWTMNSPTPTRAAASAPKAWESAVRWGMAVMGTQMAIQAPRMEPIARPAMIQTQVTMCVPTSVPTMAANMPASAMNMPRRAVSGCDMPLRENTKRMEAIR